MALRPTSIEMTQLLTQFHFHVWNKDNQGNNPVKTQRNMTGHLVLVVPSHPLSLFLKPFSV